MLDINRSSFAGVPPYRPTTGARAFRMPEAAGFDSPVGHSWAATSSALQKVCSSRGASNSTPFEPTTDGSLRPLPSFLVHCVRRRPIFASATLAVPTKLVSEVYRNMYNASRAAKRRRGPL